METGIDRQYLADTNGEIVAGPDTPMVNIVTGEHMRMGEIWDRYRQNISRDLGAAAMPHALPEMAQSQQVGN